MKPLVTLLLLWPLLASAEETAVVAQPAWLKARIAEYQSVPPLNPPRSILRTTYRDKPAYYVSSACCDIPSELYDESGALICYPDGGFAGGDGKCPGFRFVESASSLVWRDERSRSSTQVQGEAGRPSIAASAPVRSNAGARLAIRDVMNPWAVLLAAASSFLLGGLWYSRALFGRVWTAENGGAIQSGHPAKVFGISFLFSLVAAAIFAIWLGPSPSLSVALQAGFAVGFGFVAASFGINYQFARRSFKLWLIDGGYHTVQFALFGLIIGLWH
jgi:hypothetical protein